MRVLIIGGTGLISTGIVKHLLLRGADVSVFNRGKSASTLPAEVKVLTGDRGGWRDSTGDTVYQSMVESALKLGAVAVPA